MVIIACQPQGEYQDYTATEGKGEIVTQRLIISDVLCPTSAAGFVWVQRNE